MKSILAAAAILAGLAVSPALADPTTDDVHCVIVGMVLSASGGEAMQMPGTMTQMYFLGKLDGRVPTADLAGLMTAEAPKLSGDYFRNEAQRCGKELQDRGAAMVAMGQDMAQKRGVQPPPPAPPEDAH